MSFRRTLLIVWHAFICHMLWAHQDPRGDIHPEIEVEAGNFVIYFQSNAKSDTFSYEKPYWRMVYSPDGKLSLPQHRLSPEAQRQKEKSSVGLLPHITSRGARFVLVLAEGGERPLPIEPQKSGVVSGSNVLGNSVGFTWSQLGSNPDFPLKLLFSGANLDTFAPGFTVTIGEPAAIYDFPCASDPVWAGKKWWVAWVSQAKAAADRKDPNRAWRTILTSIDPETKTVAHQRLDGLSHWNTGVSMKTVGGWLCIAWHASVEGNYPGEAKIVTAFVKVPVP